MSNNSLGLTWDSTQLTFPTPTKEPKKPLFMLKKVMAEYVYDLVYLEDNPYSFLEVQTLLDGITVGGRSLFDQTQVLNQEQGLKRLIDKVNTGVPFDKTLATDLHYAIAKKEALKWGVFRDDAVGIGGTSHTPPNANNLSEIFDKGIVEINAIDNPFEKALVYFFWGSMNQFFFDGNKRTSRAIEIRCTDLVLDSLKPLLSFDVLIACTVNRKL